MSLLSEYLDIYIDLYKALWLGALAPSAKPRVLHTCLKKEGPLQKGNSNPPSCSFFFFRRFCSFSFSSFFLSKQSILTFHCPMPHGTLTLLFDRSTDRPKTPFQPTRPTVCHKQYGAISSTTEQLWQASAKHLAKSSRDIHPYLPMDMNGDTNQ